MSNINKQALRHAAVKIGAEKWIHDGKGEVTTEEFEEDGQNVVDLICYCTESRNAEFISLASPAAVLVMLADLEAAEKRIAELEAREVTLPAPACTYADHSYPAYSERQVVALLGSLGTITKVGE